MRGCERENGREAGMEKDTLSRVKTVTTRPRYRRLTSTLKPRSSTVARRVASSMRMSWSSTSVRERWAITVSISYLLVSGRYERGGRGGRDERDERDERGRRLGGWVGGGGGGRVGCTTGSVSVMNPT